MIDKIKAQEIILDIVKNNKRHQDYDRVVRYSELLKKLVTGEDMDDLVKRFSLREDPELFKQRLGITQHITKPVCKSAYRPVNKLSRVTPIINEIVYDDKAKNDKGKTVDKTKAKENETKIKQAMNVIYGGNSIDAYMEKYYADLCAYDPNAFILTSFENYDNRYNDPESYNVIITSSQAIYYEYFNNKLQYLVCQGDIDVPYLASGSTRATRPGKEYQIYVDNDTVTMKQLDSDTYKSLEIDKITSVQIQNPTNEPDDFYGKKGDVIRFKDDRTFLIQYFNQKSGSVPAVRIGCIADPLTSGRTSLSILDNAIPYLMKTIKTVSEMDLSMSLHAFPQKIVRTPRCSGAPGDICRGGYNRQNEKCILCEGTGKAQVATSSQTTIELNLPEEGDRSSDAMFDLEKIVHYVALPIDILKFQNDYIEQLKADVNKAIYNSDVFTRASIQDTATAKNIEYESVNDTLQPYGTQYSNIRCHITLIVANYLDIAVGIIVRHKFPFDYKLKSLQVMLTDLKAASDSNAPDYVIDEINRDIANNIYRDRPNELQKIQWLNRHYPFGGKSDLVIQYIITNHKCTKETEILYANFKEIFVKLEQDAELSNLYFYDYPYEEQKKLITAEVDAIIQQVDDQKTVSIPFPFNGNPNDPNNPNNPNNPGNPIDPNNPNPNPVDQNKPPIPGNPAPPPNPKGNPFKNAA